MARKINAWSKLPAKITVAAALLVLLWIGLVAWIDKAFKQKSEVLEVFCRAWPKEVECRWLRPK